MNSTVVIGHSDIKAEQYAFLGFIVFLLLACIICNALILSVFTIEKTIRNQTNLFVASLACADLVVGTVSMTMWIVNAAPTIKLPFTTMAVDILCCAASILNCALLSVERALKITCPYWYANTVTTKKVKFVIIVAWIVSIFVGALSLTRSTIKNIPYLVFISVVIYALPVLSIVVSYVSIFLVARKHAHEIRNQNCQVTRDTISRRESDTKIAWRLGIFVVVFIICWSPLFISLWIRISVAFNVIRSTLPYVNAVINPFLYALANPFFRKGMKRLYSRRASRRGNAIFLNKKTDSTTMHTNVNSHTARSQLSPKPGHPRMSLPLLKRVSNKEPKVSRENTSSVCCPATPSDHLLVENHSVWESNL